MTDDQQRARYLRKQAAKILGDAYNAAHFFGAADDALSETPSPHCQVTITAITAALRGAPEGELYEASREFYNTVATQAAANDVQKSVPSWGLIVAAGARLHLALHDQHGVAVVADSSQVVPPPALGAHEVHAEAIDAGLDLGKSGERLLAANALEHAASVSTDCDGSATAPAAWTAVPVELTDEQLRKANRLTGLGAIELRALWASLLAARPQGVK